MKNTLKKRIISVLLTLSVLSGSSLFAFAQDEIASVDEILSANDLLMDSLDDEDDYVPRYVEDEVIVMLADTPETENLQLYSVYSDDYQTLNQEATEKAASSRSAYALTSATETVTVAGSTNAIEDILDLGIEITEMKMLNPQSEEERVETVSVSRSATATNTNEKVYTVNEENNNVFSLKFEDSSVGEVIAMLNDNPMIEVAEPNYIYELLDSQNTRMHTEQYALEKINVMGAWGLTGGSRNVTVGIIDSGIDGTHPSLIDNLWINPYYTEGEGCSVCSRTDDIHGYSFTGAGSVNELPCGGIPFDAKEHGTHVAGIIGAYPGNSTDAVCGVSPYVSLVWLGCLNITKEYVNESAVIEAINYADLHNIDILNCSYNGNWYSRILENIILNYDGLLIAAAGNDNNDNDISPRYPASYECPNIIAVASSTESNLKAGTSNYGVNSVDVIAPGDLIYNTLPGGTYGNKSGTSMAAPHVAGIAALYKALRPNCNSQQIKAAICNTVQDLNTTYNIIYDGGIVDANAAVRTHPGLLRSITFSNNYSTYRPSFVDYVVSGNKVRIPEIDPEREDYIFTGWYTSSVGGQLFDFNNPITSNTILYAHWEEVEPDSFAESFPDKNFRNYVLDFLNSKDQGNRVASTEISSWDIETLSTEIELDVSNRDIRNLSGIEYFTGLETLLCNNNKIQTIDLTELNDLKRLECFLNSLTSLNLNNSTKLQYLDCQSNSLTSLNLSNTPNLEKLYCSLNLISSITTPTLTKLKTLECGNSCLSTLDLNAFPNLEQLTCSYNYLSSLDLSNTIKLTSLSCSGNKLDSLDLTHCPNLRVLSCANNNLSSLNVLHLKSLWHLRCDHNNLTDLNVTHLSNLKELYCYNNNIVVLNAACSGLTTIDCRHNALTKLNVIGCDDLINLKCNYNRLTILNIRGLDNLEIFYVDNNEFNAITDILCNNSILNNVVCFGNQNTWNNNPFIDLYLNKKAVQYVYENNLMGGTSATTFSPYNSLSKVEFAEILYNMAETPAVVSATNPFTDFDNITYADSYNAVMWAYTNGFIEPATPTTFNPEGAVTREMAALALYRYADEYDIPLADIREYTAFADESSISANALTAVQEMYEACLINPTSVDDETGAMTFSPNATLTRIDAAVLIRLFEVCRLYL